MPQQTEIFRVFVCSTFTDMKEERGLLQNKVFKKLEELCELNNAKFQAVDLRWGINAESQLNQKTLEICLKEIARCQEKSPKLNFLILLGNKYGWQPVPWKIPADEMEQIHTVLVNKDRNLIDEWYKQDENAIPAEYVLKPRDSILMKNGTLTKSGDGTWEKKEKEILAVLRNAVSMLSLRGEQNEKYFTSAIHREIISGLLNPGKDGKKPEEHVFAFIRKTEELPANKSAEKYIDWDSDEEQRRYCADRLDNLKSELSTKLGNHYLGYNAGWKDGELKIDNPEEFCRKVYDSLEPIIKARFNNTGNPNEIEHEVYLHRQFKYRLNEYFRGRTDILEKIRQYIKNTDDRKVLLLVGDPGSGKSSIMAQAIRLNENSHACTVYRFIGTTAQSSDITSLLRNVCGQIEYEYGFEKSELPAGEIKGELLYQMPVLAEVFRKCLALGTPEKPVVVFLDAPDQLSGSDDASSLYWIPKELPGNARIIVSGPKELEKNLPGAHIEQLPALPEAEARQILDSWLEAAGRRLTAIQYKIVIDNFSNTCLPVYLKLAFERAKQWHSYDNNPPLKDDVNGIINDYFDWLNTEHTEELVRHVVCYMLCGRYQGLTENELHEILFFDAEYRKIFLNQSYKEYHKELDEATKIPFVVLARLFFDLQPFLTERDADGIAVITFFHRQFIEVLKKRYEL